MCGAYPSNSLERIIDVQIALNIDVGVHETHIRAPLLKSLGPTGYTLSAGSSDPVVHRV